MEIQQLRREYQHKIFQYILYVEKGIPSLADKNSQISIDLAWGIIKLLDFTLRPISLMSEIKLTFEEITKDYIEQTFSSLKHFRPGNWIFSELRNVKNIDELQNLVDFVKIPDVGKDLRDTLGHYVVKPDVVVARIPVTDEEINQNDSLVEPQGLPRLTPLRRANHLNPKAILHASISCKLTLRSDRSQNARTEGLNLIRNRKGHTPHIAVVTAEPMPTRLASLALGTGDIDCVYHFALYELLTAAKAINNEAVVELIEIMIEGKRLRDIADLPFDLAI